jgi:hypothetical protein
MLKSISNLAIVAIKDNMILFWPLCVVGGKRTEQIHNNGATYILGVFSVKWSHLLKEWRIMGGTATLCLLSIYIFRILYPMINSGRWINWGMILRIDEFHNGKKWTRRGYPVSLVIRGHGLLVDGSGMYLSSSKKVPSRVSQSIILTYYVLPVV